VRCCHLLREYGILRVFRLKHIFTGNKNIPKVHVDTRKMMTLIKIASLIRCDQKFLNSDLQGNIYDTELETAKNSELSFSYIMGFNLKLTSTVLTIEILNQ
jgi:hypothetical protein